VALLDYGQVKEMPEDLRLAYANLVVAMADDDFLRAEESFRYPQLHTMHCSSKQSLSPFRHYTVAHRLLSHLNGFLHELWLKSR
jgi:hypothetical protein